MSLVKSAVFFLTSSVVDIIAQKFKILFNNKFGLTVMIKKEKCKFCGKTRFRQSTEQKGNVWVSKIICKFCERVVKIHTLNERVKDAERK